MLTTARIAIACAALTACEAALPRALPTPAGQTDLVVERHLASAFGLRRARVALDGAIVFERVLDEDAPVSLLTFRAPLAAGDHYVQLELDVVVACGVAGDLHAAYTVHGVRAIEVAGGEAGSLTVDLHTRGVSRDFGERLEVTYRAGGTLHERHENDVPGRYRAPERCPGLAPVARAFCRAEAYADEARRDRDVVRLLCTTEKLRMMRELGDTDDAKVVDLGLQAGDCVGLLQAYFRNFVEARSTCPEASGP